MTLDSVQLTINGEAYHIKAGRRHAPMGVGHQKTLVFELQFGGVPVGIRRQWKWLAPGVSRITTQENKQTMLVILFPWVRTDANHSVVLQDRKAGCQHQIQAPISLAAG